MICEKFVEFATPGWLMNLISVGIEKLIISSRIYVLTFSRVAVRQFLCSCFFYGFHNLVSVLEVLWNDFFVSFHKFESLYCYF